MLNISRKQILFLIVILVALTLFMKMNPIILLITLVLLVGFILFFKSDMLPHGLKTINKTVIKTTAGDVEITTPNANITLNSGDGSIVVDGKRYNINDELNLEIDKVKEVEVLLPQGYEKVIIAVIGGDISAMDLNVKEIHMKSVDGDIKADNINADKIDLKSVDGKIMLSNTLSSTLDCKTTSSNISIDNSKSNMIETASISGNITSSCDFETYINKTTSGKTTITLLSSHDYDYAISTLSATYSLPDSEGKKSFSTNKNSKYTIYHKSVSGDIVVKVAK